MTVERPNILLVITDQQSASMMSCTGNKWLRTPAMDSIAQRGVHFNHTYCTNPVCVPSRFSLMTGRMPSEMGLHSNSTHGLTPPSAHIVSHGAGHLLRKAGYETVYCGKQHLPLTDARQLGFELLTIDERDDLAETCVNYLKTPPQKPFFMVASFINPHDICYMAIRDFTDKDGETQQLLKKTTVELSTLDEALRLPENMNEKEFFENYCPPLPPNFEPQSDEPEAVRMILEQRPFKAAARRHYTPERWRMHRWAYRRLTEMVDKQIGRVINALKQNGLEEETVVIFTSDHGDMDSAHRMEHKTVLYEEACRVPLIIAAPDTTAAGTTDERLVSNGLDLLPTLCDYAEIEPPKDIKGLSLRAAAEGRTASSWRNYVEVESEFGKMIAGERYKYILYDRGANREQLVDLTADPGEMRNAAILPENQKVLQVYRRFFTKNFHAETPD